MLPLILLLLTAPDSAKLTLLANTKEIFQRDNVLLLSLLENESLSAVRLFGEIRPSSHRFRHEILENGRWVSVIPANDPPEESEIVGTGVLLEGKSIYAECDVLHRRSFKGAFLFETPGTYDIRVVATMPWGELPSEPVTITVRKRPEGDLKTIESLPANELRMLAVLSVHRQLPESLLELKRVDGNIAWTIEQWQIAQTACDGGEWKGSRVSLEKNCEWMQKKMDPIAYEHSLERLGSYYRTRKHWEGLSRVARSMKYDSKKRRGFIYQLDLLTKPPTPAKP